MTVAWVICNGTKYWSGDPESVADFGFAGLSSAQLFPTRELAERVIDVLDSDDEEKGHIRALCVEVHVS